MIPRKKLQLLLYMLHICYVFGDGETSTTNYELSTTSVTPITTTVTPSTTVDTPSTTVGSLTISTAISQMDEDSDEEEQVEQSSVTMISTSLSSNYVNDSYTVEQTASTSSIIDIISDTSSTTPFTTETVTESDTSSTNPFSTETVTESIETTAATCTDNTVGSVEALEIVNTTSTSIFLTWSAPEDASCLNSYMIAWFANSVEIGSDNIYTEYFNVTDLEPCISYSITVQAISITNDTSEVQSASGTTSTKLSAVQNLVAVGLEYGLNVTWDAPVEVYCVEKYLVEASNTIASIKTTVSTNTTDTNWTISDLKACALYTIVITPISSDNVEGTTNTIDQETAISKPGSVQNLIDSSITGYSIALTWDAPNTNAMCVSYYSINTCDASNNCFMTNSSTTSYNITGLSACMDYTLTVVAVGDAFQSDESSVAATTSYVIPGAPQSLASEPGEFSLNITWDPPSEGATCIKEYRVTVWNISTNLTTDTHITMTGLYACTTYTVQVNPVSITSGDGAFSIINETTAEFVTNPPLMYIEPWVTNSTISIGWLVESYMNNCELQSVITICNATSTKGHGYDSYDSESNDSISTGFNVTVNVTVFDLSPFTTYSCRGITVNSAGKSELGDAVNATTSEDFPSEPRNLTVHDITDSSFTLTWAEPGYLPGNLINYEITLTWKQKFLIPSWCPRSTTNRTIHDINGTQLSFRYRNASPFSEYHVRIKAKTGAGWGDYGKSEVFDSEAGVPDVVTNLTFVNTENANDSNALETILSWGLPCSLNGDLELFKITVHGTRDGFANDTLTKTVNVTEQNDADKIFTLNFGELKAEYNYVFKISAKVLNGSSLGLSINFTTLYPAGIPEQPDEAYIKEITIEPTKALRTTSTATIILPLFPNTNGNIHYYAIMIAEQGQNPADSRRMKVFGGLWPNTTGWSEAMAVDPIIVYQGTEVHWNPYSTNNVVDYGHLKAVKYVLGTDTVCGELSSNINTTLYCNGPLKPDTWYHVRMRAFTYGGYADSKIFTVKTDAELNVGLVIGTILGILTLGIGTTLLLLLRRGFLQTVLRKFLHSDMPGNPMPPPFPRKKFILHCQQLADNPGKLNNEYQLLHTISLDLQMPTNIASLQANRRKNRYTDILPYDFSRVKLDIIDNDPATDYINASFINGASGEVEYIACQGPKEETIYDFWRMIDQYDVKIIVMVTQLVEKGKEKCHQYYPNMRENFEFEDMAIRCTMKRDYESYTQRTILLQKESMKRNVMHLHFKDWPDHDVPEDYDSMINFCQIMRKHILANKGLVAIHCSAGVGRTGTLIAIDILMQQIRENKKLDVFGTVYRLRKYRINMVQRESQYAYIYNCIRKALKNPYILKTFEQMQPVEPIYENVPNNNTDISSSHTNLVNSMETLKKSSPSASIDSMEAIYETSIPKPIIVNELNSQNKGLRYSKSATAIYSGPSKVTRKEKYGSHDFPIYDSVRDAEYLSSRDGDKRDHHDLSRSSTYENLPSLSRSTSTHSATRAVYSYTTQKSLDKDTSI